MISKNQRNKNYQIHEPANCEEYPQIAKKGKKPGCEKCWDKGFSSELTGGNTIHADFEGDGTYKTGPMLIIRYCNCKAGKRVYQKHVNEGSSITSQNYKLPSDFTKLFKVSIIKPMNHGNNTRKQNRGKVNRKIDKVDRKRGNTGKAGARKNHH